MTDRDHRAIVRARAEQIAGAVVRAAADEAAVVPRKARRGATMRLIAMQSVSAAIVEREVRARE